MGLAVDLQGVLRMSISAKADYLLRSSTYSIGMNSMLHRQASA